MRFHGNQTGRKAAVSHRVHSSLKNHSNRQRVRRSILPLLGLDCVWKLTELERSDDQREFAPRVAETRTAEHLKRTPTSKPIAARDAGLCDQSQANGQLREAQIHGRPL